MTIVRHRHTPSALTSILYARRRFGWSLFSVAVMWFVATRSPYLGKTTTYGNVCSPVDEFFRAMSVRRYGKGR